MKQMKYIIVDNGMYDAPVIFDIGVDHFDMARNIVGQVISAGFINILDGRIHCYGESHSLCVKSRPEEDSNLINSMLGIPND